MRDYTLGKLGQDVVTHVPAVIRGLPQLVPGFVGHGRLAGQARAGAQLRLARLVGCPVCAALFPGIARRAGLSAAEVEAAARGEIAALPREVAGSVAVVEETVRGGGQLRELPEAARALTDGQREHLVVWIRLELVVHSVGLLFLPQSMIDRASAPA